MLDKKTTTVLTAIQIFEILDHIHCWQFRYFSFSSIYSWYTPNDSNLIWCLFISRWSREYLLLWRQTKTFNNIIFNLLPLISNGVHVISQSKPFWVSTFLYYWSFAFQVRLLILPVKMYCIPRAVWKSPSFKSSLLRIVLKHVLFMIENRTFFFFISRILYL